MLIRHMFALKYFNIISTLLNDVSGFNLLLFNCHRVIFFSFWNNGLRTDNGVIATITSQHAHTIKQSIKQGQAINGENPNLYIILLNNIQGNTDYKYEFESHNSLLFKSVSL